MPPQPLLTSTDSFHIGPWQIDPALDQVSRNGQARKLEPRSMRLLVVLAQAGGEVISANALLEAVWPGLVVTPSSLYDAVAQLRKVLGPEHIGNVARKGYRLLTAVRWPVRLPEQRLGERDFADAGKGGLGARSIAVLPFDARGLPETLSFLRESLTGALIAELSRQPGLTVVARGTMLTFADSPAPPQKVAQDLGVRFVVDGLIELRGDTLHVSVQLADGWQGTQTWADELELPAKAWHETAAVVVGRLARALHFELADLAAHVPRSAGDAEMQARALSAQAWVQLFARPQTRDTNEQAVALAEQALSLAPRLAQAWMCLAYSDWRAANYGWSPEPMAEQKLRAMVRVERAVELDLRDPDSHFVLGLVVMHHGQLLRAEEALRHCLRLTASFAPAHGLMGLLRQRRGYPAETAGHCQRAFAFSPREPLRAIWHGAQAMACLDLGDAQAAFEEAQRGMAVNPTYPQLFIVGAAAAQRLGAHAQAQAWVTTLRDRTAFNSLAALRDRLARTYDPAALGSLEAMVDLLREAGLPAE